MISLMLAAFLMAGEPAAAPAATAAAPAKAEKAKPGPNEMVCKKEAIVGSRMKTRVCLTQQEWDQRRDDSKDELTKVQRNQPFEAH